MEVDMKVSGKMTRGMAKVRKKGFTLRFINSNFVIQKVSRRKVKDTNMKAIGKMITRMVKVVIYFMIYLV